MLKFTERPKTPGINLKKSMAFPEGNKLFVRDLRANLMKQTLIWFNLQRNGTGNGLPNIKNTFAKSLQLQNVSSAPKYLHLQGWSLRFI